MHSLYVDLMLQAEDRIKIRNFLLNENRRRVKVFLANRLRSKTEIMFRMKIYLVRVKFCLCFRHAVCAEKDVVCKEKGG